MAGRTSELRMVKAVIAEDQAHAHMPDYSIDMQGDVVIFLSRGTAGKAPAPAVIEIPRLDPDIYDMARDAAPGWDVHMIEAEWRAWVTEPPKNPELAFLGFCKKWFERRGRP